VNVTPDDRLIYCPLCGTPVKVVGNVPDDPPDGQFNDEWLELSDRVARQCSRVRLNAHGDEIVVA
jgi:hypothetical protein